MRIIFITILVFLTGCAAKGPLYQKDREQSNITAIVYFYRPSGLYGAGYVPAVYSDGVKNFSLKQGGYNFIELNPGDHQFVLKANWASGLKDIPFSMSLDGGKKYYVKMTNRQDKDIMNNLGLVSSGVISVYTVSEEVANRELATSHLSK